MTNKFLLGCGVVGGPLFIVSSLVQATIREGFDLRRHHLSTLALGDYGWVQTATFAAAGLMALMFAVGIWRMFRAGALCFGLYGVAMIVGALFPDQPAFGFPPGPPTANDGASLHAAGAISAFLAQVAACVAFGWHFVRERRGRWAAYSIGSGLVAASLVFTMDPAQPSSAPRLVATCIVTGAWMTAVAIAVLRRARR